MALLTIALHQVAFVVERGFDKTYAASILGFVGIVSIGGRVVCGIITDKIGHDSAYTIFAGSVFWEITINIRMGED